MKESVRERERERDRERESETSYEFIGCEGEASKEAALKEKASKEAALKEKASKEAASRDAAPMGEGGVFNGCLYGVFY